MTAKFTWAALVLSTFVSLAHGAGLADISNAEASSGVKDALVKGAEFAVSTLGREDGFLGNPQVKIPLPGALRTAEKAMRTFGMGKYADDLVVTMNRAAEQAVAEAKPILIDSVKKMTPQDAKGILTGGDDSVTQFFRRTSSERLTQKFMPIVRQSTRKLELAEKYNNFAGKAASAGLLSKEDANLDAYITQKAMDGMFLMIAEKEKEIRQNPLSAGSDILKKVFGSLK